MNPNSITARKQRWADLYDQTKPAQYLFTIAYAPDAVSFPWPWPANKRERIEAAWLTYERMRDRLEWLDDDSIPHLNVGTGTELFAEALGCKVHRPADNMPFALPMISSAADVAKVKVPELSTSSLAYLFDMADELRARSGPEAVMKMVDIQSPMDIAALLWDKSDFYIAMLDEPAAVKELAAKAAALLTAFLDEWFARYGVDFVAHYPSYYLPQGVSVSEDEVGAVNSEIFAELFAPELTMLSERYGGLGMHCCANSHHQWAGFKEIPGLKVLNLGQPNDVVREAYKYFAPVAAQMHGYYAEGDPWTWPSQLPETARIIFEIPAADRDKALMLAERMGEVCRR